MLLALRGLATSLVIHAKKSKHWSVAKVSNSGAGREAYSIERDLPRILLFCGNGILPIY